MVSSLGSKRYGSLQRPGFPEALAISLAKSVDTKLSMMQGLMEGASAHEEFLYTREFGNILIEK